MTEELAQRVRERLGHRNGVSEVRMMGGLCFLMHGNMLVGTMKNGDLLARVGTDGHAAALARPGAGAMLFTGRAMKGFVVVSADVLDDAALDDWLSTSLAFVEPLPPKPKKAPKETKAKPAAGRATRRTSGARR
jgi:hypothetical protein